MGRRLPDSESTAAIAPLLTSWCAHLDYERTGYVLEGYHISPETAAELAGRGFVAVALGYGAADVGSVCVRIREHEREGEWTEALGETELSDLVARYIDESRGMERRCGELGLPYFDVGQDPETVMRVAEDRIARALRG